MRRVRFVDPTKNSIVYPGTVTPPIGALVVNPLLAPATLLWDVRVPIESHVVNWTQQQRSRLAESASQPPTGRLELQSPQLPWRVKIRPRTPNTFVTVYDVLVTIQTALGARITPREWDSFADIAKHTILTARGVRVRSYDPGRRADESFHHPRRIDSLGKLTQFAGLSPTPRESSLDLEFRRV